MNGKDKTGKIALIMFIMAAALLSAAQTVVVTGISDITADFHTTTNMAQLIYSSFLLVLGVMIPLSAFIARRFKLKGF